MFRRRGALILIAFASLFVTSGALAQTVVSRARLGNMIEDITFVSNGRLANNLAFANGEELLLAPLHAPGGPKAPPALTKLFDFRSTPMTNGPRGIVYIPSQKLFAFHSANSGVLYFVDENGVYRGSRTMVFPGGAVPIYLEGMDYLPKSCRAYPDHLVVIVNTFAAPNSNLTPRIEVTRLDGTVEAEIVVQPFGLQPDGSYLFDPSYGLLGLAYQAPDRLLVTVNDGTNNIWALDFNGNVIGSGPVWAASGMTNFEGLVQVADGRLAATDFLTGLTLFFDKKMNRLPDQDRTYSVGIGVGVPNGLAWDSDTDSHLVLTQYPPGISTVSRTLDSATNAVLVPTPASLPVRLAWVSNDHMAATWARHRDPSHIMMDFIHFYNPSTGVFLSEVDHPLGGATPEALEYIPWTDQFAVVIGATSRAVGFALRNGETIRTIDITATGLAGPGSLAVFAPSDPSGGRMLLCGGTAAAVVDFNGTLLPGGFDIREKLNVLGSMDISAISTGPQAGAFALLDRDNNELVVFTLP